MPITQLDVVNECLGTLGEAPLNELDDDHDMVASALRMLKTQNTQVQATGWWFNKESIYLTPDPVTKYVYVPNDCAGLDTEEANPAVTIRGRTLYRNDAAPTENPMEFDGPVAIRYIREVPFEDLPPTAAVLVQARTVVRFQSLYDGDSKKNADLKEAAQEAFIFFNTEHIRNVRANLLRTPTMAAKMMQIGPGILTGRINGYRMGG